MDAVGGRRSPDLIFPNFGRRRPAQGRPGAAPAGHWLPELVGFSFLSFNSATATYRSWGDTDAVSFVVSAYFTMVGLFFCIKKFQAAPANSRRRNAIGASVFIIFWDSVSFFE
ncbi:unnamed protein product [Miscanthus lutarioriparius]|uniref:Uncharacterized protein n=1 Tax=Miscanthus lutarioriparius TaxID=422564 RepID=A0A811PZ05_9POAL|nr:unnamed protein product [Miscanthus lutarioriparius]